ncbi:MAG: sodium:calcium antiporter [Bacteroides sp.]|nr:sodium:calcium antiporter [Bacteroides sp.]
MWHDILFLCMGLVLVMGGANYLTDGATAVARRFNMSDLIIGITVVAFGSSTPDLVISLTSTIENKAQIAMGDILGANIFDLLLVIGICALVRPVVIGKATLQKEFPMVILSSGVLFILACDMLIDGAPSDYMNRSDGLILLCFFIIYSYVTYMIARAQDAATPGAGNNPVTQKTVNLWLAAVMIVGGLAALVIGGNWIVSGASGIARSFGMSEAMVGLTVVAIGSSIPDLVTSLIAAVKGHSGIAIGNVVGSCVLNVFLIVGICATVKPLELGSINAVDFAVLLGASILLWVFGWVWGKRTINRWEGAILTLSYVGYMAYLVISAK